MQLGKSIVGALIGGALGIGLLIAIHLLGLGDYGWLAIPVALLTGLGVRWMVATKGHASYARGALTGMLALAAFVVGNYLVAQVAMRNALAARNPARVAATEERPEGDKEAAAVVEAPVQPVDMRSKERPQLAGADAGMRAPSRAFSTMDFVWLSVAALVAYELGRGSGSTAPRDESELSGQDDVNQPMADA